MQKFVLPLLVIVAVALIYFFYFSPHKGLGAFSTFDKDSHANREIKVRIHHEEGIQRDATGRSMFFVSDAEGVRNRVTTGAPLPVGFENSETAVIVGHFHGATFEAVEVKLE